MEVDDREVEDKVPRGGKVANEDDDEETNDGRLSDENADEEAFHVEEDSDAEEDVLPNALDAGEDIDYRVFREAFYSEFLPTDDQSNDGENTE